MGLEVEHKFLVCSDAWHRDVSRSCRFRQGYLGDSPAASVRVRIEGEQANLNIKGMTIGVQRPEFEYPVPLADADALLDQLCRKPLIEKIRHFVPFAGHIWEVDVFLGDNAGLVVAEIELEAPGEAFSLPPWAGAEVSGLVRYYNVSLVSYPYRDWTAEERAGHG
ncbi:MAG: CYTH domain-containing protein [Thiothrix sp.]|nr:CYTH domain-containing protein [Thiothrix sp.]HPQ96132.1 CYTH domain-containing protein [Thiolinea sp.]